MKDNHINVIKNTEIQKYKNTKIQKYKNIKYKIQKYNHDGKSVAWLRGEDRGEVITLM